MLEVNVFSPWSCVLLYRNQLISYLLALAQVTGLFHDPSIGNAIHIVLVRLILFEEVEVRFLFTSKYHLQNFWVQYIKM